MRTVHTLAEVVDRDGPLPPDTVRRLAESLAAALARMHAAGLVHGFLTADQILLTPRGPRVRGFAGRRGIGSADSIGPAGSTGSAGSTGPTDSADPADAAGSAGSAGDVSRFAELLLFASGGEVGAGLGPLVRRCLAADPAERPTAADLDHVLNPRAPVLPAFTTPPGPEETGAQAGAKDGPASDGADGGPHDAPGDGTARGSAVGHRAKRKAAAEDGATGNGEEETPGNPARRRIAVAGLVTVTAAAAAGAGVVLWSGSRTSGDRVPAQRWSLGVGGRLTTLQAHGETGYTTGTDMRVRALGMTTGVARWTARTEATVWSDPVITAAHLYATCPEGWIHALDAGEGGQVWRRHAGKPVTGSPAVSGTALVVGTADGGLSAYDMLGGEPRWTWSPPRPPGAVRPAGAGALLYLAFTGGRVAAFDPIAVEPRWTVELGGALHGRPYPSGNLLHVVRGGELVALGAEDGRIAWTFSGSGRLTAPAFGDAVLCVTGDGVAYGVDPGNGRRMWSRSTGATVGSPATVADGVAYVGGDGVLHAFDARTGRTRWSAPVPAYLTTAPAVAGDVLLAGTAGSRLIALDL